MQKFESVMVAATPLWLRVEVLNLIRTLLDLCTRTEVRNGWLVTASAIVLLRDDHDRDRD